MAPPTSLGIDGCRGGWLWIGHFHGDWRGGLVRELDALLPTLTQVELALIDMPIGLLEGGPKERECDREARALLGRPRASSVFRPPCRAALAALAQGHAGVCAVNRQATGTGLSLQTFNIMPKIEALDRLLQGHAGLGERLRESHPELCFQRLNRGIPLSDNKRSSAGRSERRALVQQAVTELGAASVDPLIERLAACLPRRELGLDDIIDAAVLALAALQILATGCRSELPSVVPRDANGLPMAMLIPA
jgi:predicted RNase H-like nuclease